MTWISAGIGAGTAAINLGRSIYKSSKANKALGELNKTAFPEISVSPELQSAYTGAQSSAKYGFSPEETASFNQQLARSQNTQFQQAKDIGGGQLSGTINKMNNIENIGAINTFAAKGAGLKLEKQQHADDLALNIQSIKNRNDEQKIAQRVRLEQAYGGAKQQQQENINQAIGGIGAIGAQAASSYAKQRAERRNPSIGSNSFDTSGLGTDYSNPTDTGQDPGYIQ